ncbi:RNA 2',3'-cyclic phosphodiesterase [Lutibaculum baratangense]|uniref:RNA 2',3'-cyclic phosphodiesterase n=1 Tax=Lutibaculum baratangense AMV1 TaxID=631454 RepID=V4TJC1_9HYPH|nr:RNA 2',3'-cyclic phosphodiesterase [Lutibaculum baratangense]ESR26018.1 2'-5' RNA ligase [Lutibaculum baratangense AMV1]
MPRLFTGLEIPEAVAAHLTTLRGGLSGARWIDPENYHVTLRFIGDVENGTAAEVHEALRRVRRGPFTLQLTGLDAFGGRKPHSIHASVQPSPALHALQAEHERLMQMIGLPPEGRRYSPHVMIARLRGVSAGSVAGYLEGRGGFMSMPFEVTQFVLFSARASTGGGPYVVEEEYPLEGG